MKVPLRCYPVSKPSKLQVVGSIPQHWTEERAKFYFHEVDERSVTGQEELLSVSHVTGVTSRRSKSITMFMAESNVGHKVCRPGDLVVNTMWAWMAALGVAKQDGLVSPAYGVYRPIHGRSLSPRYTDKLLRTPIYADEYFIRSTGIRASRLRLYPDQFLRIPIICPPSDEQAAIVRFLDHVDRKFRRFIQAKRRLIELLNEQKQSIINQAVTRGLDHDATFRASGIDWLGDVPEHWEVCRLRNVVTNVTSGSRGWSSYAADEGPLFLRIANLRRNALELRFDDVVGRVDKAETPWVV